MSYCNLHSHTYYSVLDGISKPIELARAAVAMGMKSLAITDHGTLGGWPEFSLACQDIGIKPIFGMEAYYVPDRHQHELLLSPTGKKIQSGYHLVLLAKNMTGCRNLIKLNNLANLEGFYYRPKMDWEILTKYREGLIIGSACLGSELSQHILGSGLDHGLAIAKRFKDAFGDDYYIEVMDNRMASEDQRRTNKVAIEIAKKLGTRIVPTNDSHYIHAVDQQLHDLILAIRTKEQLSDPDRKMKYDGLFHMKTIEEMKRLFPDYIKHTEEIAERIELCDIFSGTINIPVTASDPDNMLEMLAEFGLQNMGLSQDERYVARLKRELAMIQKLKISSYFLATKEIVDLAASIQCQVGWARGSAGGSLVCYSLGITKIDPIKYDLLFERFINEYRKDWPDIDLDVPQSMRKLVIQKMGERFGADHIAHISTVLYFNPKILIRDICRAVGQTKHADRLSSLVPFECKNAEDLQEKATGLKEYLDRVSGGKAIWDWLVKLLGVPRHVGVHPSGIIVSNQPIIEQLPIRCEKEKRIVQFPMHFHKERDKKESVSILDKFGILKFDILGLKTLDVVFSTAAEVGLDVHKIRVDDQKVFDLICRGDVAGVFQLDDHKRAVNICKKMQPRTIDELAILLALNRPGLLDSGESDIYLARRVLVQEDSWFLHPSLKSVLQTTYGICVFQEDMMKMVQIYAGYNLNEAEELRKGIGKKDKAIVERSKNLFIEKSAQLGHPKEEVDRVLQMIDAAGRYSFNKSHAVGYAMITYISAYLATYYPLYFFKNIISLEISDKRKFYLSEAMIRGIKLLHPDVNLANKDVSVDKAGLRLGLLSIHRIGEAIANKIIAGRPYNKMSELIAKAGKATTLLLHAAGATQSIPDFQSYQPPSQMPEELDLLGISINGLQHKFREVIDLSNAGPVHEVPLVALSAGATVIKILEVKEHIYVANHNGNPVEKTMAFVKVMDVYGPQHDLVAFDDIYKKKLFQRDKFYMAILERTATGSLRFTSLDVLDEPITMR